MRKTRKTRLKTISNKKSFWFVLALSVFLFLFNSCENFLNGGKVKDEITDAINYNNAPSFIIKVEALKGAGRVIQPAEGQVIKKVTDSFPIKFEPSDTHQFFYWEAVSLVPLKEGEKISDYVEFKDKESLETVVKFKKASSAIIIRPVCPEKLILTRFNMDDADKVYERDSTIELEFNKPITQPSLALIDIKIPGIETEKKSREYFKDAIQTDNKVYISANVNYNAFTDSDLIPVAAKAIQPVSVDIPSTVCYINNDYSEPVIVELESKKTLTYYINSKTQEQSQIQFSLIQDDAGHFYVDGDEINSNTNDAIKKQKFSVGQQVDLRFRVSNGWTFLGWKITRQYTDEQGETQTDVYTQRMENLSEETNLGMYYGDEPDLIDSYGYNKVTGIVQATLIVSNYKSGQFTVEPETRIIPTSRIIIDGQHGKFSPSKGEITLLEGSTVTQNFEPDSDYAFVKWEIVDANNNFEPIENGKYIVVNNSEKEDITYTLTNAPGEEDGNVSLVLRPKVLERPQTISTTPLYDPSGTYRDVNIMVMFDTDMDENSIFYTEPEIATLKSRYGLIDDVDKGSDFKKNKDGKYYGYKIKENGKDVIYFKNIQITNNRTGESLTQHFDAPVFNDLRTLVIPANKENPLPPSVTVLVVLSKDFYFTEPDLSKSITMREAKKWVYFVNNSTDKIPPTPVVGLKNWRGDIVTRDPSSRKLINGEKNLKLDISIDDNASGIPEFFTLKLIDPVTNSLVRLYDINYTDWEKTHGEYNYTEKTGNTTTIDYKDFNLETGYEEEDPLPDGNYNIAFIFKDNNDNTAQGYDNKNDDTELDNVKKQPFCITLDSTPPQITGFRFVGPEESLNDKEITLRWVCTDADYAKAVISYKKLGEENWHDTVVVPKQPSVTSYTKSLTETEHEIEPGTTYVVKVQFYDSADNITEYDNLEWYTLPVPIDDATFTAEITGDDKTELSLSWIKPEGNFTGVKIEYKKSSNSAWSSILVRTDESKPAGETETFTISGLHTATTYLARIASWYEFETHDFISEARERNNLYTAPEKTTFHIDGSMPTYLELLCEQYDIKENLELKIYRGTKTNAPDDPDAVSVEGVNVLFDDTEFKTLDYSDFGTSTECYWVDDDDGNELIPGTMYYYKVVPEYHGVKGEASYCAYRTDTAAVTNLRTFEDTENDITVTANSIPISWHKADGNFESYIVIVNNGVQNQQYLVDDPEIIDADDPVYVITGLEGGKTYSYKVKTVGSGSGYWDTSTTAITEVTAPNAVPGFTISKSSSSITVNFTKPANSYNKIEWYCSTSENDIGTLKATVSSSSVTQCTINFSSLPESAYYIRARTCLTNATTGVTRYAVSEPLYFSKANCVVSNIKVVSAANTSLTIKWDIPDSSEFTATTIQCFDDSGVEVDINGSNDGKALLISNNTTHQYTISSLSRGQKYRFKIQLTPSDGSIVSAITSSYFYTNPNLVTDFTAASSTSYKDRVTLSWTNPTGYYSSLQILNAADNTVITTITSSTQTSYTHTGLIAGETYKYKIRVLQANTSYGSSCTTDEFSTSTYPYAVTGLSSTVQSTSSVKLSWTAPSTETGKWDSYTIWYWNSTNNDPEYTSITGVNKNSTYYTITGLTPGCYYYFYVTTVSTLTTNSGTSYIRVKPTTVTGVSTSKTTNSITLNWTNPTGHFDRVKLYYKKSSDTSYTLKETFTDGRTSYTVSDLLVATKYDFKFQTNNNNNSGANYNNEVIFEGIATKPSPISNLSANGNAGGIILSWDKPTDNSITSTDLYYQYYDGYSWSSWYYLANTSATTYTISSSDITRNREYQFKVQSYNSNVGQTGDPVYKTFYSAPPTPNKPYVYQHDGLGTYTLRFYMPGTTLYSTLGVNVYLDGNYDTYREFENTSSGGYQTITLSTKITTSGYHSIYIRVYHKMNSDVKEDANGYSSYSDETYATAVGESNYYFYQQIFLEGSRIDYALMENVITQNKTITGTGTTGAFVQDRNVTLTPYSIGRCEVTEYFYNKVMGISGGSTSMPKVNVSWYEAIIFCNRLSIKLGLTPCYKVKKNSSTYYTKDEWLTLTAPTAERATYWCNVETDFSANGFHLPTECQWEMAARGGNPDSTEWSYTYCGCNYSDLDSFAWYTSNSSSSLQEVGRKSRMGSIALWDMSGNASEWTNDYYRPTFVTGNYTNPTYTYDTVPSGYQSVMIKGGCFADGSSYLTAKNRLENNRTPNAKYGWLGFRIVRNATK